MNQEPNQIINNEVEYHTYFSCSVRERLIIWHISGATNNQVQFGHLDKGHSIKWFVVGLKDCGTRSYQQFFGDFAKRSYFLFLVLMSYNYGKNSVFSREIEYMIYLSIHVP